MLKAVLLDISGVLYQGTEVIPGAVQAVQALRDKGLALRFVTNTSRKPRSRILKDLQRMGFELDRRELFTAPLAARRWLEQNNRRPLLLVHPDIEEEFNGIDRINPNLVLLADAADALNYHNLDEAFSLLIDGAPLLAIGINRYFRDDDRLHLDAGPFVRALEYAAGIDAVVAGKPSPDFFAQALADIGCRPDEAIMVGDDVDSDVIGAIDAGLHGCLVKTGKYRPGDEERLGGRGRVVESLSELDL